MKNLNPKTKAIEKITRRITWISKSIIYILPAFIFEPRRHPWIYIFDYLTVSAEKRYSKTYDYLNKYFSPKKIDGFLILNCIEFSLKIPNDLWNRRSFMIGFLSIYYDIVYPVNVRFPIPVIVEEGPYELAGVDLKEGDYVIDAGANIGIFSMHAAKKIGPLGKVFSFEPIREARVVIDNSVILNKYSDIITTIPKAIGEKEGVVDFKFEINNIGGSSPNAATGAIIKVPVTTIDQFVKDEKINKVDFIKMDIEGAECDALRGATETILKMKPKLAICTYHKPTDAEEIQGIILGIRPDYKYHHTKHKIYAW